MKANELRIGNWVMYSSIIKVNENKIIECVDHPDRFAPIPLTEEWLEQFGFETEGLAANDCRAVKGDFYITLDHDGSTVIGYPTSIGMRNKWMFVQDIEHVHQLQNLYFALTGEELNQNKEDCESQHCE